VGTSLVSSFSVMPLTCNKITVLVQKTVVIREQRQRGRSRLWGDESVRGYPDKGPRREGEGRTEKSVKRNLLTRKGN